MAWNNLVQAKKHIDRLVSYWDAEPGTREDALNLLLNDINTRIDERQVQNDVAEFEADRARRLAETDWTELSDAPLSIPEKSQASAYRQLLRGLPAPAAIGDLEAIMWPNNPIKKRR